MHTSLRGSRVAFASGALLVAVALSACGVASSGSDGGAGSSPTASAATSPAASTASASAVSHPTTATAAPTAVTSASTSAGGPVPNGFAARSVTFVSSQEAFVLGTAPCAHAPCTSILRTLDRGASWRGLPAPVVPLGDYGSGSSGPAVWGIRFASPSQGFVFGNGLWETTDGGEQWSPSPSPSAGAAIESLEIIDGQVLALVSTCTATGGCAQTGTLVRRPLAGGSWQVVAPVSNPGAIATQARVAAVLDGSSVIVTTDGGVSSVTRAAPCVQEEGGAAVAVTGPDGLALMCGGDAGMGSVTKTIYVSDDLGAHWTEAGSPARGGDPEALSAGSAAQLVVAAASGASMLYYSTDGGARWATAYYAGDGGLGFADLGFTTATDGVVVYGPVRSDSNSEGRPGRLLLSSDGGASWQAVSF